jgi:hypothetical protein
MKILNLLLRFLLEVCALIALGYWGLHAAGLLLCIGAPLLFALLWGLFAAHKAKFPPPQPWKAIVGAVLLEVTPLVLLSAGQGTWAAVLALVIAVNSGFVYLRKYQ